MMGCTPCTIAEINKKLGNIIPTFDRKSSQKEHDDIVNRFYTDYDCLKAAAEYAATNAKYQKKKWDTKIQIHNQHSEYEHDCQFQY